MDPVSPVESVLFVGSSLVIFWVYGAPIRRFSGRHLPKDLDQIECLTLTLAFGAASLPLIVMLLTLTRFFNNTAAYLITLILVVVNFSTFRNNLRKTMVTYLLKLRSQAILATLLLFFIIFIVHILPTISLYVHPGDDPKLYSLITLRIVEDGGYTKSWGMYADPSWYHEKTHLIIAGYAGICAYLHLLTSVDVGKIILMVTPTFTSLISSSVYFIAKRLFHDWRIGFCSAFVFGLLTLEPNLIWFTWGGHAELSSLFLLPILLGLYLDFLNSGVKLGEVTILAYLMASLATLHPFAIFYALAFIITSTLYFIVSCREAVKPLKPLIAFPLSIIFILPIFVSALQEELMIMPIYSSVPNPGLTPMFSLTQSAGDAFWSAVSRMSVTYGLVFPLLLLSIVRFAHAQLKGKRSLTLVMSWAFTLFLLHENSPNGLFLIKFPLWYRLDSNRTFNATSIPVSIIVGMALALYGSSYPNKTYEQKKAGYREILHALKCVQKLFIALVFLVILQLPIISYIYMNGSSNSPITKADIVAFNWIQVNTLTNSTFFVLPNDAGQWIPVYAKRIAVIPFGIATKHEVLLTYYKEIYPNFCIEPTSPDVLEYFRRNNVTHVYIGAKTVLPQVYRYVPAVTKLLNSTMFKLVYVREGAYIFEYLPYSYIASPALPITITNES